MDDDKENYMDSKRPLIESTGEHGLHRYKFINYSFGDHIVKVIVSENGEFLGITEIKENKRDFLTYKQKFGLRRSGSAEELYRE